MPDLPKLSKFLSRLLRHDADTVGLVLDEHGYTDLSEVWKLVEYRYPARYKLADLQQVVAGDATGKQRFELVDSRIRALYGHSAVRLITYEPVEPPELLYHGTSANAWAAIRANGLLRQARQYVHSQPASTAQHRLARGTAVKRSSCTVRAASAHRAGVQFYHPETDHYLAEDIPVAFISFQTSPLPYLPPGVIITLMMPSG